MLYFNSIIMSFILHIYLIIFPVQWGSFPCRMFVADFSFYLKYSDLDHSFVLFHHLVLFVKRKGFRWKPAACQPVALNFCTFQPSSQASDSFWMLFHRRVFFSAIIFIFHIVFEIFIWMMDEGMIALPWCSTRILLWSTIEKGTDFFCTSGFLLSHKSPT